MSSDPNLRMAVRVRQSPGWAAPALGSRGHCLALSPGFGSLGSGSPSLLPGSSRGLSPITLPVGPQDLPASPGVSRLSPHSMSAIVSSAAHQLPPLRSHAAQPSLTLLPPPPGRGCGREAHSSHWLGTSPPSAAGGSLLKGDTATGWLAVGILPHPTPTPPSMPTARAWVGSSGEGIPGSSH